MNKFTLLAALVFGAGISNGQDQLVTGKHYVPSNIRLSNHTNQSNKNGAPSTINAVLFSEDFATGIPATWGVIDNVASTEVWTYGLGPQGVTAGPNDTLLSATGANGFAIIDDDFYGQASPANNTDLISPAINCTGITAVKVSFADYFRQFAAIASFDVSNDSITWTPIFDPAAGLAQNAATANPRLNDFDISAVAANQATVYLRFHYEGNWDYWWQVDDISVYEPNAVDGGVTSIDGLSDGCGLSAATPISVTITNNGSGALTSVPVSYTINAGTPVNETFTGNIAAFGTATYTFTATANLSAIGAYAITATTSIPSDANAANDASSITVNNNAAIAVTTGTPFTEGFESVAVGAVPPTGWATEDTDGDGANWDFSNTLFNTGAMCARIGFAGAPVANAENWLITPCLDLIAGTNYQLNYFFKSFDATATSYEIETRFGTSAVGSAMTTSIATETLFPDDLYHLASHTFTVPASGSYNVGFNGFGAAPAVSLRIDDVELTVLTGINNVTLQDAVKIAPNPTNGIVYITSKANENVTVAVYNNMGQEVASYNFNQAFKTQIDLSAFANGIYTIRLNSANESLVSKVVLNK